MKVMNVHKRELPASMDEAGALINRLASKEDRFWPDDRWPPMRFDRPLGVGAVGGHGPIKYTVESYEPGRNIQFRLSKPDGYNGVHRFDLEQVALDRVRIRHVIDMRTVGGASVSWFLVTRPLHDALLEDALDRAEMLFGGKPRKRGWSYWVKLLRWVMGRRRAKRRASPT